MTSLKKTPLYDYHVSMGGDMKPFAGFAMPISELCTLSAANTFLTRNQAFSKSKTPSILDSHKHVREKAGLFDVSHMLFAKIYGKDRVPFIERVTVGDFTDMKAGTVKYSLLTNENGGIIDDLMVGKGQDHIQIVVNAGCRDKDIKHISNEMRKWKKYGADLDIEVGHDLALLALQGPVAARVLQRHVTDDLSKFLFMEKRYMKIDGITCHVTRSGYTGEDGFEIAIPDKNVEMIYDNLISEKEVEPAGLGCRDTLRLEAGLPLYGHDMNDETTPVEAGLAWAISPARKAKGGFIGDGVILKQLRKGGAPARRRVGLITEVISREHTPLVGPSGTQVGEITSGLIAPTLNKTVAFGYVDAKYTKVNTNLKAIVRGKERGAVVAKSPFVAHNYYRGKTNGRGKGKK